MAELTRVITIEGTLIGRESEFISREESERYWKERFSGLDNVSVKVQDFILEDKEND